MALPPGIILLLIGVAERHRFVSVAGATLVIYDHLITINQEKEHIWEKKFSFFSYLYVLSRYVGDVFVCLDVFVAMRPNSTVPLCLSQTNINNWLWKVAGLWAQLILLSRVWALYHRSKKILAVISVAWIVEIVLTAYSQFMFGASIVPIPLPLTPNLHFCVLLNIPPKIALWLIPLLLFETLLFALAALECGRQTRNLIRAGQWTRHSLFLVIFRDSLVYFFIAFTIYTAAFVATTIGSFDAGTPLQMMLPGHIMISTRLTLNLRQAVDGGGWGTTERAPVLRPRLPRQTDTLVGDA